MAKAKVTLLGSLSLSIGGLRLQQNKPVTISDPALIAACKGTSGVAVEELEETPLKPAAKSEAKAEKVAAEEPDESESAKAQLASRRKVRSPKSEE